MPQSQPNIASSWRLRELSPSDCQPELNEMSLTRYNAVYLHGVACKTLDGSLIPCKERMPARSRLQPPSLQFDLNKWHPMQGTTQQC